MAFFASLHHFSDVALLVLRLGLGAVFLSHGLGKRKLWSMQPSQQMPAGMLRNLRILSIAEPAGGLGLLVGFLTQHAALGLVIVMLGARQQVGDAEALGPACQVRAIETRALGPQDADDVAPLPVGHLTAAPKPLELAQDGVLGGIDSEYGARLGADAHALPPRHTAARGQRVRVGTE